MTLTTSEDLSCLPDAIALATTNDVQVSFSHIHLYVDKVENISVYKELEDKLNDNVDSSQDVFIPQSRDIVKQLLAGLGFRVTGARVPSDTVATNTRSVLVTSKDPEGVQFVVTTIDKHNSEKKDEYHHFDASKSFPQYCYKTVSFY